MRKLYMTPIVWVIKIECGGALLQVSGNYNPDSIKKEEEETLVKSNRGYSANSVEWTGWE